MILHNNKDEQKIIDLYQKTRQQQPSTQLDNKILAIAKDKLAINKNKPRKLIWALSSVAVIVLSVNVALKLVLEPTTAPAPYAPTFEQQELMFERDKESNDASEMRQLESKKADAKEQKRKTIQRAEKKKMLRSNAEKLEKRIPRVMHSPLPQASQKVESQLSSDTGMAITPLPIFPFNAKALSDLYPTLIIKQKHEQSIQIYNSNALILSLNDLNNGSLNVAAYPQDNELNLHINWALKPNCNFIKLNNQCAINSQQTGWYDNSRLIKVTWSQ